MSCPARHILAVLPTRALAVYAENPRPTCPLRLPRRAKQPFGHQRALESGNAKFLGAELPSLLLAEHHVIRLSFHMCRLE
jgi:hypothetical protein